jgi:putative pyruvate formate lyase activating enzyme
MFEPSYIKTFNDGTLRERADQARGMLKECTVCPRECGINRLEEEVGFCGLGSLAMVASANPHFGEEAPLVGRSGSGTIFLTSCNLKCVFCQNYEISHMMEGQAVTGEQFADIMLALQRMGCHNINFVTPSHLVPQILEAVLIATPKGLNVPLVYNSGGYDLVKTLQLLDGVFDIYMPDLKFMSSDVSHALMKAPDYPTRVRSAIKEMRGQVGDLKVNDHGIAERGLLVRHLVMPDNLAQTQEAMKFLAEEVSTNTYVNIMNQYRPCGAARSHEKLGRSVTREEYNEAVEQAKRAGITRLDDRVRPGLAFF